MDPSELMQQTRDALAVNVNGIVVGGQLVGSSCGWWCAGCCDVQ